MQKQRQSRLISTRSVVDLTAWITRTVWLLRLIVILSVFFDLTGVSQITYLSASVYGNFQRTEQENTFACACLPTLTKFRAYKEYVFPVSMV